jgi:ArsR family transcriptional regulator, arsenate/arsenite/antimonite-responsive transcriptional repressor / arsenate reductase (thioredoxin)
MSAERSALKARARVHAALGDPARLAIVDRLAVSDASPGEIGRLLDLPTNLVAFHLGVLEAAGVIERSRSEGDRRRSYLRLVPTALSGPAHPSAPASARVVFVCTHNSARSQFAAALLAARSTMPVTSAGTRPADRVHPRAVEVGRRHGLRLGRVRPVHVAEVVRDGDLVVSVCDPAHESLSVTAPVLHWSVPDPARVGTDEAFERAYADISARVDRLIPVLSGVDDD